MHRQTHIKLRITPVPLYLSSGVNSYSQGTNVTFAQTRH